MVVTHFHVQWNTLFTGPKQKLIVFLYLSYLLLPNKDSARQTSLYPFISFSFLNEEQTILRRPVIITLDIIVNVP